MERIFFSCALIVIAASGFYQGVTAGKPKVITPAQSEVLIQEGEELKIQCQGEGKLQFSTQKLTSSLTQQSEMEISNDPDSGVYTLIRHHAMRTDTGWYACAEEGIEIDNTEQTIDHPSGNISWIYVYVNSTEPFAVMEALYEQIGVMAGDDLVVPCRPTSPNLPVTLRFDDEVVSLSEDESYDPKIGFVFHDVGTLLSGRVYQCKVVTSDEQNPDDPPLYNLHVAKPRPMPKPVINLSRTRHVVWGGDLVLECNLVVEGSTQFMMDWTLPESVLCQHERCPTSLIRHRVSGSKETWKKELIVKNVQKTDEGNYTCTARGIGTYSQSSIEIETWDPSYTYANVRVDSTAAITIHERSDVQWKIIIDTYPEDFSWEWFKEDGTQISMTGIGSNARYSHDENKTDHFFRISNVGIDDSGNYTLDVFTAYNKTSIILPLTVVGAPFISVENALLFYRPGALVTISARTFGSPLPTVTWIYKEYPDYPSQENSQLIPLLDVDNRELEDAPLHIVSQVKLTINMTGDLIVKSCNEINCTESTQQLFVSDVAGAFGIIDPGDVTERDDITVPCGASVYNYTDEITWNTNDSGEPAWDAMRMSITKRQTNFTWQAILRIREVKKSDSGQYECAVRNKEGNLERFVYELLVEDAQSPRLTHTNMNETQISLDLKKDKNTAVTLECYAVGRPIPRVTWHKNGEVLKESRQYKFFKGNSTLHISYFSDAETDSGRYLCNATNRFGTVTSYMDIKIAGKSDNIILWISLICVLIVIIILVITYMGIKVHRERVLRKELLEAGLTHFEDGALECLNPDLTVDDQAELLPYDKKWEFPREYLKLGKQLGSGAFGVVMKAEARGICVEGEVTTVAVKMVRRSADPSYMKALSSELKIMIHLGRHLNVVNLLGACTKTILTKRELYVIVEYCRYGNLHNYLQRHRSNFIDQIDPSTQKIDPNIGIERLARTESVGSQNRLKYAALSFSRSISIKSSDSTSGTELVDYRQGTDFCDINMSPDGAVLSNNSVQPGWRSNYRGDYKDHNLKPICTQDLLCWAWQVARGMEYLSSRNVLHGDLAARNILLADDNIVKICDFGLAKNMYKDNNYKKKGDGPLPIKWMAVESIRDRMFSTQSDVWSFGIVLWEFFTLARTPYPGMEAERQYDRLIEGYRMEKPEYATDEIYDFMLQCWKAKPSLRPLFPDLAEKIGTLLNESIKMYYLDLNTPYTDMNTMALQNGQSDYLTMMSSPNHDYHNSPDPTSERRPDSAYLSMSPLDKTSESGIFSPRSELEESHFKFPAPSKNTPINSDSEDCIECAPMLTPEDPYVKPIDVQQRRAEFVRQSKEQAPVERDSGYCNITSNSHLSSSNDQSSEIVKNSDQNLSAERLQKNNNKLTSPIISGSDNYVNMPKQKSADRSTVDVVGGSFSNPSYVIMSKLEEERQFA